jgi:hypothetical protein
MGARAGFGLSMVHYAFSLRGGIDDDGQPIHTSPLITGLMMALGAFLTLQATIDYIRVKALHRIMTMQFETAQQA